MKSEIILYQTEDGKTQIQTRLENETVWLTQEQMAELFQRESVITKHIGNAFKEGELEEKSNVQNLHISGSDKPVKFYNLDVEKDFIKQIDQTQQKLKNPKKS
jgi:hypothetical protein